MLRSEEVPRKVTSRTVRAPRLLVLGCLFALGVGCTEEGEGPATSFDECPAGEEGCACTEGDGCDAGLGCQSGTCVATEGAGGAGGPPQSIDHCDDALCKNGTCESNTEGYTCSCDAGWTGDACDQEVTSGCNDSPCEHGACTDLMGGEYSCACESGWSGPNCDDNIDDCESNPCEHGTCTDGVDSYTCTCDAGFEGATCGANIDDCASDPCENGTCTDDVNGYSCACETGWTGANCDEEVKSGCEDSPCSHGSCTDTGAGAYSCSCDAGWDGGNCDACAVDYTLENGACIDEKLVACNDDAPENATTTIADVTITFTTAGGWTTPADCVFSCKTGWEGATCSQSSDDCAGNACQNGGACVDGHQGYSCSCPMGFSGDFCEVDIDDCSADPCDHGTCVDGTDTYSCSCETGWDGAHCDACATDFTLEGGACIDQKQVTCSTAGVPTNATATIADVTITYTSAGGWTTPADCAFSCHPGWEGANCSLSIDDCPESSCQNGGTCVDEHQGYSCSCPTGFSGDFCETNIDDCHADPCAHGECTDGVDSYSCTCNPGWDGDQCDVCATDYTLEQGACINETQVACNDAAPPNATSTPGSVTITYTTAGGWTTPPDCGFSCNAGWEGADCSLSVDDCIEHACQNGSACVDEHQGYSCDCPAGYDGNFCEIDIDECASGPCDHGTCTGGVNSYSCACDTGWDGDDCDVPTVCSCPGTEVCDGEGACYEPGLIDDFRTCDLAIDEAEGRHGDWFFYRSSGGDCSGTCDGVSVPPWASECGAWIMGSGSESYAGMGFGLDADGPLYDGCDYEAIEVTYASDQPVTFFVKWNDVGEFAPRASVTLPATSGTSTETVDISSFAGVDCSALTEFQFEPTDRSSYGIAVYDVRFTGGSTVPCTNGALRCDSVGDLEECIDGTWTSSSCATGQHCYGDQCVDDDATPVDLHGHLSVSGTQLVDEFGQPVQLKGISTNWLNWADDGYQLSLPALEWMRDNWNLSVFRAAMGTEEENGYLTSNQAGMLAEVETIIDNAVSAGVYVIVDWHTHHAETQTAEAVAFFEDIADRYGYLPNVIFETYNEPLSLDWNSVLKPYHETLVSAIRGADSDANENVIILGTPNWDQDVNVVSSPSARVAGDNLMYALHFYACDHQNWERSKAQSALSAGVPLFVSEWGATAADGGIHGTAVCSSSADAWHSLMDANKISWAAWKLDDCDWEINEYGVADTSCLLAQGAPLDGGWTSEWLNGHAPYVVSKMQDHSEHRLR